MPDEIVDSPTDATAPSRRSGPPWFLFIVIVLYGAAIVYIHGGDRVTDTGVRNFFTLFVTGLAAVAVVAWFVFFSGLAVRTRRVGGLIVVLVVGVFFTLFRFEDYSGSLVPGRVVLRWADAAARDLPALKAVGVLDLRPTPADFPGFLGPGRDQRVTGVTLDPDWTARPPSAVWRQPIGEGWSGYAVVHGIAVTLEQRGAAEAVTAYDAETGALRWAYEFGHSFDHVLGGPGPRCTPTIFEGRVYALGAVGEWLCLDGALGTVLWSHDLLDEFDISPEAEISNIQYGRSNSPLLVDGMAIIPVGGTAGGRMANLVAYDMIHGDVVWEGASRQISFSSPAIAELAGWRQVLIVNEASLSGHDVASGTMLWEHPWPGVTSANANVSQAVPLPPNRVFVSKGYGLGAALLELKPAADGRLTAEVVWQRSKVLRTKLTNVVIKDGHVYGLSDGILECVRLEDGERVWKHGRYGHGQILLVGDHLLLLSEDGEVVLIEATPTEPDHVLGRFQAIDGLTWNNPALYHDLLLVRNGREAAAYRLPLIE